MNVGTPNKTDKNNIIFRNIGPLNVFLETKGLVLISVQKNTYFGLAAGWK